MLQFSSMNPKKCGGFLLIGLERFNRLSEECLGILSIRSRMVNKKFEFTDAGFEANMLLAKHLIWAGCDLSRVESVTS